MTSHHSWVINCYFFNVFILFVWVFCHTCVCIQLGLLGAPKKPKGGIGFPLELEFQIITTMRVLGIGPCSSARAAIVNGGATQVVDCYTFCSEKGEHLEFENFDYQARKEALLRIFWSK